MPYAWKAAGRSGWPKQTEAKRGEPSVAGPLPTELACDMARVG
jgi:hypothetical protein